MTKKNKLISRLMISILLLSSVTLLMSTGLLASNGGGWSDNFNGGPQ